MDNNERVVVELMGKVLILEDRVTELEKKIKEMSNSVNTKEAYSNRDHSVGYKTGPKDITKYVILDIDGNNSEPCGKSRLVYNVVKRYVEEYPDITLEGLKDAFPSEIQGSIGVVKNIKAAQGLNFDPKKPNLEYTRRYFTKENEILHLKDGTDVVVSNQWGVFNINNFIDCAKQKGFNIIEQKIDR